MAASEGNGGSCRNIPTWWAVWNHAMPIAGLQTDVGGLARRCAAEGRRTGSQKVPGEPSTLRNPLLILRLLAAAVKLFDSAPG